MTAAIWTLWLVTFAANGGGSPAVTALATYPSESSCLASIAETSSWIRKLYPRAPGPGLMFCVLGAPPRR